MHPILTPDHTSITIFDIPLILDLICDHLTKEDLWPCLQVSRYWHDLFKPQALRYVRFADLKKHQTWTILNNAAGVHCLTIDIADAGWFLDNPYSPCINLRTLRCVDFGYMQPQDNECDFSLHYEHHDTQLAGNPVDPRTNALNLVQLNPKLTTLEVIHGCQRYRANHLTPSALVSISKHQSLSLLKIDLEVAIPESFLVTLLQHLPLSLEDLSFSANDVRRPSGTLPAMTGLILHERTNLRRITLRPCGIWFTVWATDAESYTHGLILQLLQNSPQLVDLSLSGYCGQFVVFLQTLVEFCPLVETINYEGHSRVSAEVVAMTGSLSHLREFRLKEYCEEINEVERQLIPNFLRRSSATLEVISVQLDYNANYFDTKTAVWTFWPECPRLREYIFVLDWIHGVIVPDDYLIDTVVELLSRPTVACWNLQKLGLLITDHKSNEECARHSYKSWGQDTYDHQQNFLQSIQPLYSCLRSFKRLRQDNLFITWNICASTSMMSLDMVLPRINGHPILALDTQPPGPAHTRGSSSSSSGGSESELPQRKEPAITRRELDWIGLGRRWLSGTEKQEQTEKIARTRNLRDGERQNRDLNARIAWTHNYKRVGCGWKDWKNIAGLHGCVPADDFRRLDCEHEDCFNEFPNDLDEGLDRMMSGYYFDIERGHRRRSMQRCRRKHI